MACALRQLGAEALDLGARGGAFLIGLEGVLLLEDAVGEELVEVPGLLRERVGAGGQLGLARLGRAELFAQRGNLLLCVLERDRHPVEREDDVRAAAAAEDRRELEHVVDVPLRVVVGEDPAGDVGRPPAAAR